jgi:hypothetical protein
MNQPSAQSINSQHQELCVQYSKKTSQIFKLSIPPYELPPYELKAIFLVCLTIVLSLKILSTYVTYLPNEIVISYLL